MVTALYRRYRPDSFAALIGQEHVTKPLMTALRTNRVNHAYLFSGPRGCGKTTSARILARCLNCVDGPTDTPCGVCPSCVELSTGGSGSLDVVEIDAASHGGVDDARDLRERAFFAPARDRYKVFIIDEAHMVTPGGFNALLKIVEEPPEHVTFVFATTEPDKVIGTIRSRTHHYPFRLVPPATMTGYLEKILDSESVSAAPGVLPLIVRAGGGSVRDTLSVADQLIAGSDGSTIGYDHTVTLLGYTPSELLTQVLDALAVRDPAGVFAAVERVIESGQDPRRFVEDLLDRLRDLILVASVGPAAESVLASAAPEDAAAWNRQASAFGAAQLVRAAALANAALTEMVGATSQRIHLEVLAARLLLPESDDTSLGTLSRLERLERRTGVEGDHPGDPAPASPPAAGPVSARSEPAAPSEPATVELAVAGLAAPSADPAPDAIEGAAPREDDLSPERVPAQERDPDRAAPGEPDVWVVAPEASEPRPTVREPEPDPEPEPEPQTPTTVPGVEPSGAGLPPAGQSAAPALPLSAGQMRDAWVQVLERLEKTSRSSWTVMVTSTVVDYRDEVLTLAFPNQGYVEKFRGGGEVVDTVRGAIHAVIGVRVRFRANVLSEEQGRPDGADEPAASDPGHAPKYGEAVIREMLNAVPIDDENGR